jgi:L-alanine-DL-glutamate epimerase-like enolase superfamily enzyme
VNLRITDVQVHLVDTPADPFFRWREGIPGSEPSGTGAWLRLLTDEGTDGVAFSSRGVIAADVIHRRLRDELIGADPALREHLWNRVWELDRMEEFPIYILGLVDVALWDLLGKVAGLPAWVLLGGARTQIAAYASTATFPTEVEFLDVADQCIELGYKAIKLHAWGDARRDAKLCARLRAHVGDDVPLMYDGSAAFDLPDAIYLGRALADNGFLWYEEPMREFSVRAHAHLAQMVQVPLLVGETSDGVHMNMGDFVAAQCAPFVRTSARLKGGFTGALRIAHLADSYRLRAEVHSPGLLSRHLCMAVQNTTYYESLVLANPVEPDKVVDAHGYVHAPRSPGVGYEAEAELPWNSAEDGLERAVVDPFC